MFTDRLAVPHVIDRIQVGGLGIVFGAKRILESLIHGLRLIQGWILGQTTQVPLADMGGLITRGLQHFRQRDFFIAQMHRAAFGTVTIHARASRNSAGHETHSSRRTIRSP